MAYYPLMVQQVSACTPLLALLHIPIHVVYTYMMCTMYFVATTSLHHVVLLHTMYRVVLTTSALCMLQAYIARAPWYILHA